MFKNFILLFISIFSLYFTQAIAGKCVPRMYPGKDTPVCVCNCTYCDTVEPIGKIVKDTFVLYITSKNGTRLERSVIKKRNGSSIPVVGNVLKGVAGILLDLSTTFQTITGFGGSITDEASYNIKSLHKACPNVDMQDRVLRCFFDPNGGLEYNLIRIPIGSNDGSTRNYTYDDGDEDFNLTRFRLAPEDLNFKIPVIKLAQAILKSTLKIIASSWSAPAWMKRCNCTVGGNPPDGRQLKGDPDGPYYRTWANYMVKFIQDYKKNGVPIWAVTTQNEIVKSHIVPWQSQTMLLPAQERDYVKLDLGPALKKNGLDTKIFLYDDDRLPTLPAWVNRVCADAEAKKYVSGVGLHWYFDGTMPAQLLDSIHKTYPDLELLATENYGYSDYLLYWAGMPAPSGNPSYGVWQTAVDYTRAIITDLNHWVTGWIDWCLVVDTKGGPQWIGNLDASVIANTSGGEFLKQPIYYAMGHFSKFIPPGSKRIGLTLQSQTTLDIANMVAFVRPDGYKVVVILNDQSRDITTTITFKLRDVLGEPLPLTIPGQSIITAIFE